MLIEKLNGLKNNNLSLYKKICNLSLQVKKRAAELNTDYRLLAKRKHPIGWLIAGMIAIFITFPLFIYGNIFNLTFLEIPNLQIKKIRDRQFHSSVKYGLSLAMAFIFLPVYLVLAFIIFSPWWLAILIFLTLPLSGLFAWNYFLEFRRIAGGFRVWKYMRNHNSDYVTLKQNHDELIELLAGL